MNENESQNRLRDRALGAAIDAAARPRDAIRGNRLRTMAYLVAAAVPVYMILQSMYVARNSSGADAYQGQGPDARNSIYDPNIAPNLDRTTGSLSPDIQPLQNSYPLSTEYDQSELYVFNGEQFILNSDRLTVKWLKETGYGNVIVVGENGGYKLITATSPGPDGTPYKNGLGLNDCGWEACLAVPDLGD